MKQARTLTDKQLKIVYAHCATRRHATRDRAIIAVSFMAGLRAKEMYPCGSGRLAEVVTPKIAF